MTLVQIKRIDANSQAVDSGMAICRSCKGPNCCQMEPPFLTAHDIETIEASTDLKATSFADTNTSASGQEFLQMRKGANGKCRFYDESRSRCNIYGVRPTDCKLFPLDIKKLGGEYRWILYESCPLESGVSENAIEEMVNTAEELLLPFLARNIEVYADIPTRAFDMGQWTQLSVINVK